MFPAARNHACALILALAAQAAADLEESLARGDYAAAESELEAIAAGWRESAPQSPDLARTLLALGAVERALGKPAEAAAHLREALPLADPADLPEIRETLALSLQDQGLLDQAEPLFRENLDRPDPRTLDHLGLLLLQQGRYRESEDLLRRALAVTPESDPHTLARRHAQLARLHHTLGSHARALAEIDTALSLAPEDPQLRLSLGSAKALAHLRLHDLEAARLGFEACAQLARERFAQRPLEAVPHIVNLGAFALAEDQNEPARALFAEALDLLRRSGLHQHPAAIPPLNNLGIAHQRLGNYGESRTFLEDARRLQGIHHPRPHLRSAETARNLAATALLAGDPDAATLTREANRLGLELLDRLLRHGTETERLNFLQQLDLLSLSATLGDAEALAGLLLASKARLLDQLLLPGEPLPVPTAEALRARLAPDTAFVDFCRFTPPGGQPRYGALLHTPDAPPRWIPLGTEAALRDWLDALDHRLAWKAATLTGDAPAPPPFRLPGILRELHREVFEPLATRLPPGCRRLALAPDGLIHGVPFAALRDADGRHLVETLDLAVRVDSGRDLLAAPELATLDSAPWTVVGVDHFENASTPAETHLDHALATLPPLPGARDELHRLRRLAPAGSRFLENPHEADLRPASPRVLHLATHSFFLDLAPDPDLPLDFDRSAELLRSGGIALPAAPARPPGPADDILFPREIAALDLQTTRLVVLSSCRSGAGTAIRGGESLGLRRAFTLAGADEVLTALWPVADDSAPAFMERFHRLALATDHPAQALWQAQREHLLAGDDPEAAILTAAPYLLTQRGPLREIQPITPPSKPLPWKWALLLIPPLLYLTGRRFRS